MGSPPWARLVPSIFVLVPSQRLVASRTVPTHAQAQMNAYKNGKIWDFPGGPVVRALALLGARVGSLVRKLRSHMLYYAAKKK